MDKKRKDKVVGIFGIIIAFSSIILLKIFTYYQIVIVSKILTFLIIFVIGMLGAKLSMRYFNQLFGSKK